MPREEDIGARPRRLLPVTALLLLACAERSGDSLDQAREKMKRGEVQQACDVLSSQVRRDGPKPQQLAALRAWIACLDKIGELRQARKWLAGRPVNGGALYGRALVEVAAAPGRLPRAVELLRQAATAWPGQGEILYRAGVLLLADEQPAAALAFLSRASDAEDTAAAAVARAHALLDLNRTDAALTQARRILRLRPSPKDIGRGRVLIHRIGKRSRFVPRDVRAKFRQALDLLRRQDRTGKTVKLVEEILMDHPRIAAAHTVLGLANLRLGNDADAVVSLRRAARLNPHDANNPLYLAVIHQKRGKLSEAAGYYRDALRHNPFLTRASRELGRILIHQHQIKEACDEFDRMTLLDSGELSLRLAGRTHLQAGSLKKAEQYFSRLLEKNPHDFETNLRMGQLLLRRFSKGGRATLQILDRATRHARQAEATRPSDPELKLLLDELTIK